MAKRDFDFKQFMLQKGERVGIGIAGGLAVLLLLLGVIMLFGKGGSLSPKANADSLDKITEDRKQKMVINEPTEAKKKELREVDPNLKNVKDLNAQLRADLYPLDFPPITTPGAGDTARRNPIVLGPEEFLVKLVHAQLSFHVFNTARDQIGVLVDPPKGKKEGDPRNPSSGSSGRNMGNYRGGSGGKGSGGGYGPQMPMGMGMRGPGGMTPGGPGGPGAPGGAKSDKSLNFKPFDKLSSGDVLAENLMPLRAAEIVGSFPLKRQLDEYKKALHVDSIGELYGSSRPQFGFRGLKVQRRTLAADGTTVLEDWSDLPLEKAVRWWALNNGRRSEPEELALEPLLQWSDHLVMDRPIQIEDASEKYPALENELPTIKKTLEDLKNLGKKAAPPKNPFKSDEDISPFGHVDMSGEEMSDGGGKTKPATGSGLDKPEKEGNPSAANEMQAPEYALIRFLDVLIEPGKTYEYKVKVLLNNPNYDRDDVRGDLKASKELESPDWVPVGHKLFVPEEIQYFAVDMRKDPKEARRFANASLPKDNQAVLQLHRWVQEVPVKAGPTFPAGEWSVAERVVVYRGENIGGTQKVKIPIWMYNQASFVLAANTSGPARDKHLIDIKFGGGINDAVLVDFTNDLATYKKNARTKDDGTEIPAAEIKEKVNREVLILTPEGKLLLRDEDTDKAEPEREERVKKWKDRIEKIEKGDKGGKPGEDIFNKGGGTGSGGS